MILKLFTHFYNCVLKSKHLTFLSQNTFENFSFHEMGVYDLPAKIDYILRLTGKQQLSYIGFSMGCSSFFALTSMKPEYNQKIRQMQGLAPVVFLQAIRSPIMKICTLIKNYQVS